MASVQECYQVDLLPSLRLLEKIDIRCVAAGAELSDPQTLRAVFISSLAEAQPPLPDGWAGESLESSGFNAKVAQTLLIPSPSDPVVCVGIGEDPDREDWRRAGAAVAHCRGRYERVRMDMPAEVDLEALVEGFLLGLYDYHPFKTHEGEDEPPAPAVDVLELLFPPEGEAAASDDSIRTARAYARAAYVARDLTNAPPAHLNPGCLERCAHRLGDAYGFEVETIDGVELENMGCGGIIGVNRGSDYAARLIRLRLRPDGCAPSDAALAMVGKGITFDSGGLSLKPSGSLLNMKSDMGGAAAILGAFSAATELDLEQPLEGWLPITDNMISGDALRVGEVVTARNGTTVEVTNTDAEGRLILMDALAVAAEAKPRAIIDIATLTGAQITALGNDIAAVMGNDESLLDEVERAADDTGEDVWELPLPDQYRRLLRSDLADLVNANMSDRSAGTIVAGLFLSNFVGATPWAHIDIAGPSFGSESRGYHPVGATGFGARLLARIAVEGAK